jgi:hypothetical protein
MQPRAKDSHKFQEEIRMKIVKLILCLFAISLFAAALLPSARAADTWNQKTTITFDQPVEVPGMILPAGTYTFQLADTFADRNVVQIFNADGSHLITTILVINDYRLKATGKTVMTFNETPGNAPEALRAWFYPGEYWGKEFVYPKVRAVQLAVATQVPVPAVPVDTLDENVIRTAPIVAETPDQREVAVSQVIATTPPAAAPVATATPAPAAVAPDTETAALPHTAGSTPLFALLGALSLGLALGLGFLLKHVS